MFKLFLFVAVSLCSIQCKTIRPTLVSLDGHSTQLPRGKPLMAYTAHQSLSSRIYWMHSNGTAILAWDYGDVDLADLSVFNGKLYVAEAFEPSVLNIDLHSGNATEFIQDWALTVFYNVANDRRHFYVKEAALFRFTLEGKEAGSAQFPQEYTNGATWDGQYLWTLGDTETKNANVIRAFDIKDWPHVHEKRHLSFKPPSQLCQGLWWDGHAFWTAEDGDGYIKSIYKFTKNGTVLQSWNEPVFNGWAVVNITIP